MSATLRTALVVAVSEASDAVDDWRERTCPSKPSDGVPAHVTVLFPFAPAAKLAEPLVARLRALFAQAPAFSFELREARRFPGVLYLAPEPPERFVRLTEMIALEYPAYPPYEGVFDSIVPHLTVAEGAARVLDMAERDVSRSLPIAASAREVLLLEELEPGSALWSAHARMPLGPP